MADAKFYDGYSRWISEEERYETWEESVQRVMNMHRKKYAYCMTDELKEMIDFAEDMYKKKKVLGAQRGLQFGGEQIFKHNMRLYNCTSTYVDRAEVFGELLYVLLCGAGAGVSLQKQHVAKLPKIQIRTKQAKVHVIEDSIEGWATALDVLMSSFFVDGGKHPEYAGRKVYFDLTKIRQKGAFISGGFKAPGPEPLRKALDRIEYLLQGLVIRSDEPVELTTIAAYDIIMHSADAVLAGGVRRSALICLFSIDDNDMMKAKTGNWFEENPQRARSNNSVILLRDSITYDQFKPIFENVKEFGEPGFYFVDSLDFNTNPCVEVGMLPMTAEGVSGFQGCNLCEINGNAIESVDDLLQACKAGAILGTLQAGYTDFKFLSPATKEIFEKEALLGVSITGWVNSPDVLFVDENQQKAARYVLDVNEQVAKIIGINPAARATNSKPSGNSSVVLMSASGINAEPAERFLRVMQMNKTSDVANKILEKNPYMVEESIWSSGKTDYAVSFPVIAPEGSVFKRDMMGVEHLKKVLQAQTNWVEYGTRSHYNDENDTTSDPRLRHNISNTITVPNGEWDNVCDYIFENRYNFSGISLLGETGDKAYFQAPFSEVKTPEQLTKEYGTAAMFASGLIVDADVFDNLWDATFKAKQDKEIGDAEKLDSQRSWIRRFRKFADNFFDGDLDKTDLCLKDVALLHKWEKIQQNYVDIDFSEEDLSRSFIDADTMGAAACSNGQCEI